MFWVKVLNYLFGWDYVVWSNFADRGIARVCTDFEGRPFYWRYKNTQLADKIETKEQVIWLTCSPQKYFKD